MASQSNSLSQRVERVQELVRQFPAAATTLNNATDQLGTSVGQLDTILKRFSFGVPTWVAFLESHTPEGDEFYNEELGYAKIGGKWGIAIKTVDGNYHFPDHDRVEQWLFNDAPRLLRIKAVDKIPDLLEALLKKAAETSAKITEKAAEVDALTAGIGSVIEAATPKIATDKGKKGR
jgi:hypothetical protein